MKTALIIPAKGKSERVENKNLYKIRGKSLIYRACEKALKCNNVSDVYLDTESDAIVQDCQSLINKGLRVIKRPKELATNDIGANELMIWALHNIDHYDLICQTFATSPLITPETIDRCIEAFLKEEEFDSFLTVVNMNEYFWKDGEEVGWSAKELPNSQDLEQMQMETHGLYGIYPEVLLECKTRVGNNPMLIPIPKIEGLDINTKEDLDIVERLI